MAARFGVRVGLGVEVDVEVFVGTVVFVDVGLGVEVLVGGGGATVEQAVENKRSQININDGAGRVLLRCIYPPCMASSKPELRYEILSRVYVTEVNCYRFAIE